MKRLDQTDIRRTVVLTGTGRVGKTTIQYQMIETLLERGIAPQKIVFISMDHPMLKLSGVNEVLEGKVKRDFSDSIFTKGKAAPGLTFPKREAIITQLPKHIRNTQATYRRYYHTKATHTCP